MEEVDNEEMRTITARAMQGLELTRPVCQGGHVRHRGCIGASSDGAEQRKAAHGNGGQGGIAAAW